jgi:hypothetical protein|nr:MAG TPA: hypothetical protein [Caudoviricetes sp.]
MKCILAMMERHGFIGSLPNAMENRALISVLMKKAVGVGKL